MKNRILSLFLAALLAFSLLPAAAAAVSPDPEPDQQEEPQPDPTPEITPVPEESPAPVVTPVPEATPVPVGPRVPNVSAADTNVTAFVGSAASVAVNAIAYDGAELSYCWYANTTPSSSNGALMNVYSSSASISTASVGIYYYYCVVTATRNGLNVTSVSPVITVTVSEISVASISVYVYPSAMSYSTGDTLNLTGLQLMVRYNNGSSEIVSDLSGITASPTQLETAGTQQIVVSYSGSSCTFPVQVTQTVKVPTSIQLVTYPSQLEYKVNEKLNTSGMVLRVTYNNGESWEDITTGFTCEPEYMKKEGSQAITVYYANNSLITSFDVNVTDPVQRIFIEVMPHKLSYTVGETLDSSGMVIGIVRYSGTSEVISGFTCSPTSLSSAGTQEIRVDYMGYSSSFYITVDEKASDLPAVSPAPSAVSSPQPTAEASDPLPTPDSSKDPVPQKTQKKDHTGLIVGIVTAMLVLLAGLASYAFVMGHDRIHAFFAGLFQRKDAAAASTMEASPVSEPEITSDTDPSDDPEIH